MARRDVLCAVPIERSLSNASLQTSALKYSAISWTPPSRIRNDRLDPRTDPRKDSIQLMHQDLSEGHQHDLKVQAAGHLMSNVLEKCSRLLKR
jgi:hypothetical protein